MYTYELVNLLLATLAVCSYYAYYHVSIHNTLEYILDSSSIIIYIILCMLELVDSYYS